MVASLILREEDTLIEKNFSLFTSYETLFLDEGSEISDIYLDDLVHNIINTKEYQNIFIPLCFGPILSDFNGLRLATHIRCTNGKNQNKNIFLFSFVEIGILINQECFGILKTKGVKLINYNFHTISENSKTNFTILDRDELAFEVKKLSLSVPDNYEDNHSITNEWGIYRWAENINTKDEQIDKIVANQNRNLYFKYLKTIFPISPLEKIENKDLIIKYSVKPKILYIDDEANNGWYSILKTILVKKNNLTIDCLDQEFNGKNKSQIVEDSFNKIKNENYNLVILDLRLHKDDFEVSSIEEITGFQILKKVKQYNKGIQVIIFSATNKIWNLQVLQHAGSNGFTLKESPENSIDNLFTKTSIKDFTIKLEKALHLSFVREIITSCDEIIGSMEKGYSKIDLIKSYFDIAINLLLQTNDDKIFFNFAYLQFFQTIEIFAESLENFSDGENASIIINGQEVVVQKRSTHKIEWPLKFKSKYTIEHHEKKLNQGFNPNRLDTNFKVSSILIFKLGNPNSSVLGWTSIYLKRNSKAAHNISNGEINIDDVKEIIKFIAYFFNPININPINISKGLKITYDESINRLKESGNFKIIKK